VADVAGLRVLILDDHEVHRRVLREQIAGWGMRPGSLPAGERPLEAMLAAERAGDPYRFVLLDCPAPVDGGIALARAIRSQPALGSPVTVMLISLGHELSPIESGVLDACLSKPVRQSQLFNALASAWAKRQGAELSGSQRPKPKAADLKAAVVGKFAAGNSRVLVVEDNAVNQKVACRMLETLGLRTDVASSGREAVEMSALVPYDLILMDCQMPEMDGYEATREIRRRDGETRPVAVIAITADAMAGSRERCLAAGMDDYISKPVRLEELCRALGRWLPQKATDPAPETSLPVK
jgi:CheY-like chemotaxis protein